MTTNRQSNKIIKQIKSYSAIFTIELSLNRTKLPCELRKIIISYIYIEIKTREDLIKAIELHKKDETKCISLYGHIEYWDVSKITDMSYAFINYKFFNRSLENWDVSSVTNMDHMFYDAVSFNQPLEKWDVSNVTNMSHMFNHADNFNQPLNDWDVSNVTNMGSMFNYAHSFNQPLEKWNVSNISYLF